jgi:alginate O-acetyltransferase complex protein AlgJ
MMETTISKTQTKSWISYLPGVFILVFLLVGAAFTLFSSNMFKSPEKPLWNGAWSAAYEADLNKGLGFRQFAIDTWGILDYALFKEGRDGVLVGRDGWLFTTEEFQKHPERNKGVQEKLELASEAKKILAEQNINLVVVLIPSKARVYSDKLGRYRFPSYNEDVYDSFARDLEALGIPVVRLFGPFNTAKEQQEVFLKTDTHWTLYGAKVAATELADVVTKNNLLPSFGMTTFTTTSAKTPTLHKGDLLNYLPLGSLQERLGPAFDELKEQTTASKDAGGGLFGESTIPVTLVGTSYSANERWNFEGALKEALGTDVLNIADEGEGPVVPMQDYLGSQALKDTPPELVVWEVPERFLSVVYSKANTDK